MPHIRRKRKAMGSGPRLSSRDVAFQLVRGAARHGTSRAQAKIRNAILRAIRAQRNRRRPGRGLLSAGQRRGRGVSILTAMGGRHRKRRRGGALRRAGEGPRAAGGRRHHGGQLNFTTGGQLSALQRQTVRGLL